MKNLICFLFLSLSSFSPLLLANDNCLMGMSWQNGLLVNDRPEVYNKSKTAIAGLFGEPLSIQGVFHGCGYLDDKRFCRLIADDWNYVVFFDCRTPKNLLLELERIPLFNMISITGDLIEEGDISALITLREIKSVSNNKKNIIKNALLGSWKSKDDPLSVIRFGINAEQWSYYNNDLLRKEQFHVSSSCPDLPRAKDGWYLVTEDNSDSFCYNILSIKNGILELMYLPRGNILTYQRNDKWLSDNGLIANDELEL